MKTIKNISKSPIKIGETISIEAGKSVDLDAVSMGLIHHKRDIDRHLAKKRITVSDAVAKKAATKGDKTDGA